MLFNKNTYFRVAINEPPTINNLIKRNSNK